MDESKASNILSSNQTKELKIEQLIKIGEETADIDGIAFYILGKHRKNLNEEQKIEYKKTSLAITMLEVFQPLIS